MKTRVITAIVGIIVLIGVMFTFNTLIFNLVITAITLIALHEIYAALGFEKQGWPLFGVLVPYTFLVMLSNYQVMRRLVMPMSFLLVTFYAIYLVVRNGTISYQKASGLLMFSGIVIFCFYSFIRLKELLPGVRISFAPDCIGNETEKMAGELREGEILLLENLRFHKEEEKNDMEFAEKLASLADLYVNDGFGVSHRAHASVEGVTHFLPAAAGFLLEKEIQYVGQAVTNPLHPFVAIIGGAKVSDKIGVISNLLDKVDTLLIGGGMANTFLAAQGYKMGKSLVEEDKLDLAKELLAKAKKNKVNMLLPTDLVMAAAFAPDAEHVTEKVKNLNQAYMALDIGAETSKAYAEALADAKMIVWNGPMGVFEMDAFCKGTEAVAKAVAKSRATSIVGGGDSVAAIEKLGLAKRITHISTGGGASLEYLEGKVLPGVAAIADKD